MNFRLKTSKYTGETLKQLQSNTNLTPNIIARIAVSLSLIIKEAVSSEAVSDHGGLEIPRNVLTGEYDYIYKSLIAQHCGRGITDEEFFPDLFNAHLERGVRILYNEYRHAGNYEKMIKNLIST